MFKKIRLSKIIDHPHFNQFEKITVKHRYIDEFECAMENSLIESKINGNSKAIILVGDGGTGKTSIIEHFVEGTQYQHIELKSITLDSNTTVKSLSGALIQKIDPNYSLNNGHSTAERTNILVNLIRRNEIQILFLDEFQHILHGNNSSDHELVIIDWVKSLMNACKIVVVIAGIPSILDTLDTIQDAGQLKRRIEEKINLNISQNEEDVLYILRFIKTYINKVQGVNLEILDNDEMYKAIANESQGKLDRIVKIIKQTTYSAIFHDRAVANHDDFSYGVKHLHASD
ncbi:TniB family NTP-binding protein [Thiomicrorhabdus indica]|uniref:TniB family NTP-binding protein n=1 Tax=Thiomicrorhabdus indica TaxID=2267253 RepID=UPI002AA9425E|nr:TniB family NTP-binding protein [Thiomicrorhabdus indica]